MGVLVRFFRANYTRGFLEPLLGLSYSLVFVFSKQSPLIIHSFRSRIEA
jgi:hypothetical protein